MGYNIGFIGVGSKYELLNFFSRHLDNVLEVCGFHPAITLRTIVNYLIKSVLADMWDFSG